MKSVEPSRTHIPARSVFARFDRDEGSESLGALCERLFVRQVSEWRELAEGAAALASARTRDIDCASYSVSVQYNPQRIVSTGARVDPASVRERGCFLCPDRLPEAQRGILYRNNFFVLCNPRPIFQKHFTIASGDHIPQNFNDGLEVLLDLTKDLGPDYTAFYNGPRCGASAPDHLHLQACPRLRLPVEHDAVDVHRRKRMYYQRHVAGFTLNAYQRSLLVVESTDQGRLVEFMHALLQRANDVLGVNDEPMVNVLCSYQQDLWRLIVFLRRKHRPDMFYRPGNERVLISPAAVDMGGLLITPVEKDFAAVDAVLIRSLYEEVSLSQDVFEKIIAQLP